MSMEQDVVTLAHGAGGDQTNELIGTIFKKHFDNPDLTGDDAAVLPVKEGKIAFSTVNLSVREVLTFSAVTQNNRFGSRLGAAFKEGWNDFVIGLQDFAIWLAEALPTLVLLAGIGTGLGFLIRAIRRKKKARVAQSVAIIGDAPASEEDVNHPSK